MKRYLIGLGLILALVLSACTGIRKPNDRQRLHSELMKWESLQGQGIIEINAMGLALRKPFVLAKNQDQLRLDVIDGGIFGATASPLISIYAGDYFALQAPVMPALEALNFGNAIPMGSIKTFSSADSLISRFGDDIIRSKAVVYDSLKVSFSKAYQLISVKDARSNLELAVGYTKTGTLDNINVKAGKDMAIKMYFDTVSYTPPEITPLPRKAAGTKDIFELLEGSGMMKIFKGFLGDQ
ncbi:MAG TPA: hypothetical protein PL188_08880 [Candidatus Cloacimonadota bacterium]|nr:hypothetical protein [Candidatus Cloacimonadota bacterium]